MDFNKRGGGTYAGEWDPEAGHIRTWFWPAGTEPSDLKAKTPQPHTWGTPYSFFRLGAVCPASHFKNMRLIFDLTLCGELGSPTFMANCPEFGASMTCEEFIDNHPE